MSLSIEANANHVYTLTQLLQKKTFVWDSIGVFFEGEKKYSIEEIVSQQDSLFTQLSNEDFKVKNIDSYWCMIQLVNRSNKLQQLHFDFCQFMDTVSLYIVDNQEIIGMQQTGREFIPSSKAISSASNYLPISLGIGEMRTYFFNIKFKSATLQKKHFNHIFLIPSDKLIQNTQINSSWYSFYAGMMVLFSLVSLFMFGIFREKVFVYFAFLNFFFTFYFLNSNVAYIFISYRFSNNVTLMEGIAVSGLIYSAFLFISNYIHLRERFPKFHLFLLVYTLSTATTSMIVGFFSEEYIFWLDVSNLALLTWVVLTVGSIIVIARQKDKSARILLVSIGVLCVTSAIFISGIIIGFGKNSWLQYSFQIGSIVFSSILFYGLFDKVNTIRNEKRRFEELDRLKSRFFANISHEFRTPLTLLLGPIRQLSQNERNKNSKQLLQMAERNAQRLLQLINQLLDLSKLEAGKMELKASEQDLVTLLKGIVMSFESYADRKDIRLHFASQKEEIQVFVDRDKIEKIFYNLLSNALKFTEEQGEIVVIISDFEQHIEIQVQDNGIGIAASKLPHIFNRFFQADDRQIQEEEGTGIGLALVKELVQLHQGKIEVESELGKGTTFRLTFLKGSQHFKESEILEADVSDSRQATSILAESILPTAEMESDFSLTKDFVLHSEELPTVLVIEDHADVRAYVKQYLVSSFQVLEAVNGEDGIEKALQYIPDLVISDVMMPKKNGYEVCQTLKTDQRTSHIPVILLTAKAAQEEKIEGLEIGADDYLVKPFDTKELEVRVKNLIEVRRQLRERFSVEPKIEPKAIQTNPIDQAFLEKVISIIEKHLSDEQFSVEVLVQEVGMSRSQLNRKLKALTNESANKFIRSLRLQKAKDMLLQKQGNISEIAFEVGFSSTSYFVKCYRDKYGSTPGSLLAD